MTKGAAEGQTWWRAYLGPLHSEDEPLTTSRHPGTNSPFYSSRAAISYKMQRLILSEVIHCTPPSPLTARVTHSDTYATDTSTRIMRHAATLQELVAVDWHTS